MEKTNFFCAILVAFLAIDAFAATPIYSSRLIHRFSDEAQNLWGSKVKNYGSTETTSWPEKKSFGHMRMLLESDLKRQRLKLGTQNQLLVASQGGETYSYGNEMGWLHYAWIDIGRPNNSFLVALDTGSDMFWVPCDCIACAPLLSYYNLLDKELGEYSPSHSNSSKRVPCSHELCQDSHNCETPKAHCPYTANYLSGDTSSSGFLFEDLLHLASVGGIRQQSSVQAAIIIGCGSKQTGLYLDGIAPDGVMGLGPGDISVPSLLAKSGLIPHSFSFCYDKSYSGRLYFGDQGPPSQRSTSLLSLKMLGESKAYIVEVENYCVGSTCLKQTGHKAQVDTGSSFTYLPSESYEQVVSEFHRQANATRILQQGFDCYKARSLNMSNYPSIKLVFSPNQSFVVEIPIFYLAYNQGSFYCLGIQPSDEDIGIIGQNFLMGYRLVFDWEKMKLGWSISTCEDIGANGDEVHLAPSPSDAPPNTLPTIEQQQSPHGHAVPPAVAGRAPPKPSAASPLLASYCYCMTSLPLFLWTAYKTYII